MDDNLKETSLSPFTFYYNHFGSFPFQFNVYLYTFFL